MKWLDIPPAWLFGALAMAYFVAGWQPDWASFGAPVFYGIGSVLLGAGLVLIVLAAFQMFRHKTTIIPHLKAAHLVRTGIFSVSRNPIYLGDVLILAGCILRWNAPLALPLVPVLVFILRQRFILAEESRLHASFGAEFENYAQNTRRWI